MRKNVLAAIDDSVHSRNALYYLASMLEVFPDMGITLFTVQSALSQFLLEEAKTDVQARREIDRILRRQRESAQRLLDESRDLLLRRSAPEDRIRIVSRERKQGVAKDILTFAQEGLYDAIVLGRRGLSRMQEMIMGSVAAGVIENASFVPVWLVDGQVENQRILVGVDGSENSLRAVEHLVFMLSGNPQISVTLFHMTPRIGQVCSLDIPSDEIGDLDEIVARGDQRCIDRFHERALEMFRRAGIPEDRVILKTVEGWKNIGSAILNEVETGEFGTVVVGRRGWGTRFFGGSVSRYLAARISNAALWVAP